MISADAATDLEQKYNLQDDPFLGGGVGINGSSGDDIAGRIISGFPFQYLTFSRILIPSVLAGVLGFVAFPALSLWLCTLFNNAGVFAVLSQDSSQFVQNFLTVSSLLFSILVGQTYYFMYTQQEMLYYALFAEVTEAKSLLEQVALVCQGRAMYPQVLKSMQDYVESDLKQLREDPAVLLSARPMDDPLESILYLTSVGLPSNIYETIFDLRQARAKRLGALQRKLPELHMWLLWTLAFIEVVSFPLLGAGTQIIGGYNILTVEGCIFGVMTIGIVMTLRVVNELWRPVGGAYNVDAVLKTMVRGLEDELQQRLDGNFVPKQTTKTKTKTSTSGRLPGVTIDAEYFQKARLIVQQSNNSTLSPSKKKS